MVALRTAALLALPACLAADACESTDRSPDVEAPIEVVDDSGRMVRLSHPAVRIVSLIPSHTDLIVALGASDRLVARTRYDTDSALADLPSLGDALTPSVEWLARQRPDLVLAWPDGQSRTVVDRLSALGIAVYTSRIETLEELRRGAWNLGTLLGLGREADRLVASLDSAFSAARRTVAGLERPAVLYLIGLDPPMAAGPDSFVDELIDIAGGRNVMGDAPARWPPVSAEEVLARDPAVVIVATGRIEEGDVLDRLSRMPGLRRLEASRDRRIHVIDADLFNRPGPRLVEAVGVLVSVIHPAAAGR